MLFKLKVHGQILIAMVLAIVAGRWSGIDGEFLGFHFYSAYVFIGTMFLNALKMIIVPLIVSSIIVGISGVAKGEDVGRLGLKTISFYALSSLIAILIGLTVVNVIKPGIENRVPVGEMLASSENTEGAQEKDEGRALSDIAAIFIRMVPTNIVQADDAVQMIGLKVARLLFGSFMARIQRRSNDALIQLSTLAYQH